MSRQTGAAAGLHAAAVTCLTPSMHGHRPTCACVMCLRGPQSNAKNYQLWNHRRKCALALGPGAAARELQVRVVSF